MIRKLIKYYLTAEAFVRIFALGYTAFTMAFALPVATYVSAALLAGLGVYVFVRERLAIQKSTDYLVYFLAEAVFVAINLVYCSKNIFYSVGIFDLVSIGTVPSVIIAALAAFYIYKQIKTAEISNSTVTVK